MLCMDVVVNTVGPLHSILRAHKKWFVFISSSFKKKSYYLITAAHASQRGATFFLVSNYCCKKLNIKSA